MKKKIGIIYSSYNNYDLLKYEVLNKVDFCGYPVVNIDDHSNLDEQKKGKKICDDNNIHYEINKGKGVQLAVKQGIEYLSRSFGCEWVFCFQQDIFPMEKSFFNDFTKKLDRNNYNEIGAMGFNVLTRDLMYMNEEVIEKYNKGEKVKGFMGIFVLSDSKKFIDKLPLRIYLRNKLINLIGNKKLKQRVQVDLAKYRVFSPKSYKNYDIISKKYNGVYACEVPMWGAVAINVKNWVNFINPSDNFIFHLWFPDIAFQFMNSGKWIATDSDLYLLNDQKSKEKYGFHWSSAHAGRDKNFSFQIEEYGNHLVNWKKKWGFDYDNPSNEYSTVQKRYEGTIIDKFYNHDCRDGPLKKF